MFCAHLDVIELVLLMEVWFGKHGSNYQLSGLSKSSSFEILSIPQTTSGMIKSGRDLLIDGKNQCDSSYLFDVTALELVDNKYLSLMVSFDFFLVSTALRKSHKSSQAN